MIERKIEIDGKPLKIKDHSRNGVTAISTKDQLNTVFNSATPKTNVSSVIRGETYAVLSFYFTYGGIEELSLAAQLKKKFDQFYYGLKTNQMMYWYRGLFPLFNKDKLLVDRLKAIVRVEPPESFRIKAGASGQPARDFADAVYAKRTDNKVKNLIWDSFKGQRTFENFDIDFDAEDERLESGTLNIAFLLVEGDAPKFAGVKIFGSRVVKKLLQSNALAFYRGFVVPHLSIFESRMKNAFQNGNFMVYDPAATLGDQFPALFEQFGRTASQKSSKETKMSEKSLRNKVIRLAHQNPALRKDLLPLITNKVAKRIEQFYMEGQYAKGFEKDHRGVGKGQYGESFKTEKDMKQKYKELKKDDSMVSSSLVMYKEYKDGSKVEIKGR